MTTRGGDERLKSTLAGWRVAPAPEPGFRARVWAGIEAAKRPASWPLYVRSHPAAFAGGLAMVLVFGAVAGREQAKTRAEAESNQLATAYVRALDARTMTMP